MPIIVNGFELTDDAVHLEMQHHPSSSLDEARHLAARALVIRQLLLSEAAKLKLIPTLEDCAPDMAEQAIDQLINEQVQVPEADEDCHRRYYEQNQDRFMDQKSGKLLEFDFVRTHIRDYLHAQSLQMGISHYIKQLAGKAQIAGFDIEGADSPLVQ